MTKLNASAKERSVPSSRIERLMNFGSLAAGLSAGALTEITRRAFFADEVKSAQDSITPLIDTNRSVFITEENIERIVNTLCKVRGAALKLGQMISLQDEALVSPSLLKIFERVRQSADFMPFKQTEVIFLKYVEIKGALPS